MPASPQTADDDSPIMLGVADFARMIGCSERHIYRLIDDGRIPPPVRIGALVRWPRVRIEAWIDAGCPTIAAGEDAHV